jgi:polyisoprenyl-phosphate glycosyltransferase
MHLICILPTYNDWESCQIVIQELEDLTVRHPLSIQIVLVNDGSTIDPMSFDVNIEVTIVHLKLNVGHQRAIAIGLAYVANEIQDYDMVVVMDSDGEDSPKDILPLIEKAQSEKNAIVFAQRQRRTEGVFFRIYYFFYKILFRLLTKQRISFGNFSCIPKRMLPKVLVLPSLWNHYSGSIIKSQLPYVMVPIDRGKRYKGASKMNTVSLIIHGLSAISIHIETVTIRLLIFSFAGIIVSFLAITLVFIIKVMTNFAIPGWASSISLLIFNVIIQFMSISLLILLLILYNRNTIQITLNKFYKEFIDRIEKIVN